MYKLSDLKTSSTQAEVRPGVWVAARPLNEDFRPFVQRVREAIAVFRGKASAFTWD